MFGRLILPLAALLLPASAAAQSGGSPRSPQVTIAVDFLRKLEGGQIAAAQALLEPGVSRIIPANRLAESARKGKLAKGKVRQLRFEGEVPAGEAFANRLKGRLVRSAGTAPAHVVCMADVPLSGYGSVGYVTVVLVSSQRLGWRVSDFRYQSEPDRLCAR